MGPDNSFGKEGNEERVIPCASASRDAFVIDIQHVTHAGEGVERDAGWQGDVVVPYAQLPTHDTQQGAQVLQKEIAVFEKSEQAETKGEARHQKVPAMGRIGGLAQLAGDREIHQGRKEDPGQAGGAPCREKRQARKQEKPVLTLGCESDELRGRDEMEERQSRNLDIFAVMNDQNEAGGVWDRGGVGRGFRQGP